MKEIINPLNSSLILLLILLLLLLGYQSLASADKWIELSIQIYGAFVATFVGIYFSLYYLRKGEKEKEEKNSKKIMLGSLKLIYSELDVNIIYLKNILEGLNSMPRNVTQLYTELSFIIERSKGIKSDVFYAAISSGDMHEISKDNRIFNAIQQAYYNLGLGLNGLNLTLDIYKDFAKAKTDRIDQTLVDNAVAILDKEIASMEKVIRWVEKAEKIVFEYLSSQGMTFSIDEPQEKLKE